MARRDIVPLGQVRSNFNYNLERKRVLNFVNVVSDEDNVKQDISIDVYGRKEKKEAEEATVKEAAAAKVLPPPCCLCLAYGPWYWIATLAGQVLCPAVTCMPSAELKMPAWHAVGQWISKSQNHISALLCRHRQRRMMMTWMLFYHHDCYDNSGVHILALAHG